MFVSPAVAGDAVIIGSCSGSLYTVHRGTGKPIWIYDTQIDGSKAEFHGEPLLLGSNVIIPTDGDPVGHVYSFDVTSGEARWKVPFRSGVATTPLLIKDRLVLVSAEGEVASIDAKSGKVFWRVGPAGTLKALPYVQSPAFVSGRIVMADNKGEMFALDPATGATVWRKPLPSRANTSLVAIGKQVVAGTIDGHLNWIDAGSGAIVKRVQLGGIPRGTPVRSGALLFVLAGSSNGRLLALDAKSGAVRWQQETPKEWTTYRPLVTGSVVIAGNEQKDLCAFDLADGTRRWCRAGAQVPRGLAISKDGVLYVGSVSGVVQAYRMPDSAD